MGRRSAVLADGVWWLAWRVRRPLDEGRGVENVLGRSDDGVDFEPVARVHKDDFGGESLGRPALVRTPAGTWRMYVSVATPGTKHWRVDLLEADTAPGLATAVPRTVLPGSVEEAVKDPVVVHDGTQWLLWASVHPLDDPDVTDRMVTRHATSDDGISWTWRGTAIAGRPGSWDARGVRFAAVLGDGADRVALYDGGRDAGQNWEERTGLARTTGDGLTFIGDGDEPLLRSPDGPGGLRYVSVVPLPEGTARWYAEVTRADGAHELRTAVVGA